MLIYILSKDEATASDIKAKIEEEYNPNGEVKTFNGSECLKSCEDKPDILMIYSEFLDEAPEIVKGLDDSQAETKVILILSDIVKQLDRSFSGIHPFAVMLQPVDDELLFRYIDEVIHFACRSLRVKLLGARNTNILIPQKRIKFIEANKREKFVFTDSGVYLVTASFKELAQALSKNFVRCHNAFLVNVAYVNKITYKEVQLDTGKKIPIGRKFKTDFRRIFNAYNKGITK